MTFILQEVERTSAQLRIKLTNSVLYWRTFCYCYIEVLLFFFEDPIPQEKVEAAKVEVVKELTDDDFLPPELKAMMEKAELKEEVQL